MKFTEKEFKDFYECAEGRAFNFHTREYLARKGEVGVIFPEGEDGQPDFAKGVATPWAEWAVKDF